MRYEVSYLDPTLDGRGRTISERVVRHAGLAEIEIIDVYLVSGPDVTADDLSGVFSDPVVQHIELVGGEEDVQVRPFDFAIEIAYRPGVTDPVAITAKRALIDIAGTNTNSDEWIIQTARQYRFRATGIKSKQRDLSKLLHNPLIQTAKIITSDSWNSGERFPITYSNTMPPSDPGMMEFAVTDMSDDELLGLSNQRLLALTLGEMQAVREYYARADVIESRIKAGLRPAATDVEIEIIAQTWSEHCKHKILNANILYSDTTTGASERVESLFQTCIRGTTESLASRCDYLRSVFHDDSGVIAFDESHVVCFKVETHNSPSALDPYGGAITGIVGVNRDILGTGKSARPIFNTNVLCFADPETEPDVVPPTLLEPKEVLRGVHQGIVDGGNQSGIPVVAGAFLFDPSYLGKPLVFCGTGGILPATIGGEGSWIQHIEPGDLAVMVGGRIGKDGIHGATFSSLALDEASPTSAVQIGDPITQKLMSDFLIEARDLELFKGITDNGAGGLSSSLGEMAEESGGVSVDLDLCPLKYKGLAPWEIFVSESQERMSLAVSSDTIDRFLALAVRREVEATIIGEFTDTGFLVVRSGDREVARLSLDFLHHGVPSMELEATWDGLRVGADEGRDTGNAEETFYELLADPNIASKEFLIRQYDHEVQAGSVVKPFVGEHSDAPSDGAVFKPLESEQRGLTITHGICPRIGDIDAYQMARCAVDEAYRAHIALGGDPDLTSALDNFCWSDPIYSPSNPDGKRKLAQLVRACKGLAEICIDYAIPLISGKDSMKNDARIGDQTISVRPTLLISLMGIITDVDRAMSTDFKHEGDLIYISGSTNGALGGTSYERLRGAPRSGVPCVDPESAVKRYRAMARAIEEGLVSSVHDCSDGGFAIALAESSLGGAIGARVDLEKLPTTGAELTDLELLFEESPSRFVVSVTQVNRDKFEALMQGTSTSLIGAVRDEGRIVFERAGNSIFAAPLDRARRAFKRQGRRWL